MEKFHKRFCCASVLTRTVSIVLLLCSFSLTACSYEDDINEKLIIYSSVKPDIHKVEELLRQGADVHARRKTVGGIGRTALYSAASYGNTEIVKLLIQSGADVNEQLTEDSTPLMTAAISGHVDTSAALLEAGVKIDTKDKGGATALIHAARKGKTEIVRLLIANGADVNVRTTDGSTALSWARIRGTPEMVDKLLRAGARNDCNSCNKQ